MFELLSTYKWLLSVPVVGVLGFVFKGNRDFFKIIHDFQIKLPPSHKKAKKDIDDNIGFTILNVTSMQTHLSTSDIDLFHKRLETFNYSRIFFKRKEILNFSKNVQRILRTTPDEKFKVSMLQVLLEPDDTENRLPYLFGFKWGKFFGF